MGSIFMRKEKSVKQSQSVLKKTEINTEIDMESHERISNSSYPKTGKVQPSGMPLFVLVEMDWSMHMSSETDTREYYVYPDGRIEWQYNGAIFELPLEEHVFVSADDYWSGLKTHKMTDNDFLALRKLFEKFSKEDAHRDGCDGTGYEMTLYDVNGKIIHSISGYIYGNEVLEDIKNLIVEH